MLPLCRAQIVHWPSLFSNAASTAIAQFLARTAWINPHVWVLTVVLGINDVPIPNPRIAWVSRPPPLVRLAFQDSVPGTLSLKLAYLRRQLATTK